MAKRLPIPAISTKENLKQVQLPEPKVVENFIGASKDAQISAPIISSSPIVVPKNQTKTFPLVLSAEVHQEIAIAARKEGKSLKDFILTAVFEKMNRNS